MSIGEGLKNNDNKIDYFIFGVSNQPTLKNDKAWCLKWVLDNSEQKTVKLKSLFTELHNTVGGGTIWKKFI